jgi:crotonobetainyl-CoA:carnitine CoA-transferase CaiB-like acyl-CoA transferase
MAFVSSAKPTFDAPLAGTRVLCVSQGGRAAIQAARHLRDLGADATVAADHAPDGVETRILQRPPAIRRIEVADAAALLMEVEHLALVQERPVDAELSAVVGPDVNRIELDWLGDGVPGSDAAAQAVSGPADVIGEPAREPLWFPHRMGEYMMGANACAMVLLFALRGRRGAVGELALSDIWAYAAGTNGLLCTPKGISYHREGRRSPGNGGVYPQRLFRAADGWVALLCRSKREWSGILDALDSPPWGQDERYRDILRMAVEYPDEVDSLVEAETVKHSRAELFARAVHNGFPLAPVRSPEEALKDECLTRQGFWADCSGVRLPGSLWRGETWLAGKAEPSDEPPERPWSGAPDLSGLRVLDLTWVWAGPMVGSMLADLGADVVKVEHERRLDNMRLRGKLPSAIPSNQKLIDPRETDPLFHNVNRGKRSILLDMSNPEGREVFLRLVEEADVVLEAFRPHVLSSWGLGYQRLAAANPRIVLLSLRGLELDESFGSSGLRSYAPVTSSLSGLESTISYPDLDGPTGGMAIGISDPVAGWHGLMLLLAALLQTQRSGAGGWLRLSQLETLASVLPEMYFAAQRPDQVSAITARALRCRDGDAIVDADPTSWSKLAVPAGISEERHATELSVAQLVDTAREVGARAWRVEAVAAHHNWQRAFGRSILATVKHDLVGDEELYGHGWQLDGRPVLPRASAPLIGQHTQEVLLEYAGIDESEARRLEASNVLS